MAIQLADTVSFIQPFVSNILLLNDNSPYPAIGIANIILSTVMGPPFVWEWNRNTATFTCVAGTTDYPKSVSDFGFLESAYLTVPSDSSNDQGRIFQVEVKRSLEKTTDQQRPSNISVFSDDGSGNITFRLQNNPNEAYVAVVTYQKSPTLFAGVNTAWPIPDKLNHIYQYGVLALAYLYSDDPRWAQFNQKFVSSLIGAQAGLDDAQKNLFMSSWDQYMRQATGTLQRSQQGNASRNV